MPELTVRATARREIKAHGVYLEQRAGAQVADRFLAAVKDTFEDLPACRAWAFYAGSGGLQRGICGGGR